MVAVVAIVALAYWLAVGRFRPAGEPACTTRQARLLVAGLSTLFVFSEWPVHDLAEGYLSVHMVQHSAYTLVLPPMFILGTPPWLWRRLLGPVMGPSAAWFGRGPPWRCSAWSPSPPTYRRS